MNTIEITVLVGIIGALGTILGIFHNRDKKVASESEFKGEIKAKLDTIASDTRGIRADIDKLDGKVEEQGKIIVILDQKLSETRRSVERAHGRIDSLKKEMKE